MALNVTKLLEDIVNMGASDLHISVAIAPVVRISGVLAPIEGYEPMKPDDIEYILSQLLNQEQKDIFEVNKEVDFSVSLGNKARFRVNAFYQKGYPSIALRVIPMTVPSLESLRLPNIIGTICELKQGLVLIVGPTSMGKSTTIASMIDRINETRAEHIITIEDPIEYIFTNKKSLIEQREMHLDTHSWDAALRAVLRQDPNIIFIGEMRDLETISAAINIAETGHLVFATLHTNSASQTIDRIISSFPEEKQLEVRLQLSQILEVVISMRLVPSQRFGQVPATEILLASDAVKNLIREGKSFQIDNVLNTSTSLGMISLERSLANLLETNDIELEDALQASSKPDALRRLIKLKGESN